MKKKIITVLLLCTLILASCNGETPADTSASTDSTPVIESSSQVESKTESETETETEKETEKAAETETEKATEKETETEAATEKATEAVTEKATEAATEKATEKETEKPADTSVPEVEAEEKSYALGWWDDWAKFTSKGSMDGAKKYGGNTLGSIYNDEGRGPFMRENNYIEQVETANNAQKKGYKVGAWIEMQGDTRLMLIALNTKNDGTFRISKNTGAPILISNAWSWRTAGPIGNKMANYIVWSGVHSFYDNAEWAGKYTVQNYPNMILPTYPDGSPATGYLDGGDQNTPQLSKLYDSSSSKDINGNIRYGTFGNVSGENSTKYGLLEMTDVNSGKVYYTDDYAVARDSLAPIWTDYNKMTVEYYVEHGVDWFWIDNWCGWDNINTNPVIKAFGDWSEAKYREFLQANPQYAGTVADDFSISAYIREKCAELDPKSEGKNLITYSTSAKTDRSWASDPLWLTYLAFKSQANEAYSSATYDAAKATAEKVHGDRDAVAVTGNDFPYTTFGAFDPDHIDMAHTEYNTTYSAVTHSNFTGSAPTGYSGHAFNLISSVGRSKQGVVWYYADANTTDGLLHGYEALAYNCTLYHGNSLTTEEAGKHLNESIDTMRSYFTNRELSSEIGVVYSCDSQLSTLAPGGFVDGQYIAHDTAYMGWCHAFDELNIPYRGIYSMRLDEYIDDFRVIILPNVRSISEKTVNDLLIPWLDKGNTLIITGADAGELGDIDEYFVKHSTNILAELKDTYKGNGKIVFYEEDAALEYFKAHSTQRINRLNKIFLDDCRALIDSLIQEGRLTEQLKAEGLDENVLTTLNYAPASECFFIDVVNMVKDKKTDKMTPSSKGATLTVDLPDSLDGKEIEVLLHNSIDPEAISTFSDYKVSDGKITVTLPELVNYFSFVIRAK